MNGKQDTDIIANEISQWKIYTSKECRFYMFDGGHFYINESEKDLVEIFNRTLQDGVS